MNIKVKKSWFVDACIILAYKVMLGVAWTTLILPNYEYQPHYGAFGEYNPTKAIIGYFLAFSALVIFWTINSKKRVTKFVMLFQLIFIIIPYTTMFGVLDLPITYVLYTFLGYGVVVLITAVVPNIHIKPAGKHIRFSLMLIMFLLVGYAYFGLLASGGLSWFTLNFAQLYDVRPLVRQISFPGFRSALIWTGYVFNLILLVFFIRRLLLKKSFGLTGIIVIFAMQIALYGLSSYKAFLILPFAILGLMWLCKHISSTRAVMAAALAFFGLLTLWGQWSIWGAALLSRAFYSPSANFSMYFQYYSTHPLALWSGHGFGPWIVGGENALSTVKVIALHYYGRNFFANAGWIADSFGNFGVAGIVVIGVILGVYLRVADSLAVKIPIPGIVEGLFITFSFVICSAALGPSLLTLGGGVLLISLWVIKDMRGKKDVRSESDSTVVNSSPLSRQT